MVMVKCYFSAIMRMAIIRSERLHCKAAGCKQYAGRDKRFCAQKNAARICRGIQCYTGAALD